MSKAKTHPVSVNDFRPGEIQFVFSRSSGPGGQNVNKVNTRVTLIFHLTGSAQFNEEEKNRMRHALKNRIDKNDCIRIHCQQFRSQSANREAALKRLERLLQKALESHPIRKKTKIPQGAVEKRLRSKGHRSQVKRLRSGPKTQE